MSPFAETMRPLLLTAACLLALTGVAGAQAGTAPTTAAGPAGAAAAELKAGIGLTQQGKFRAAIPHLLLARGHVRDEFAADFDLALCYVATGDFAAAVPILTGLRAGGRASAGVNDLLAQALIGEGQVAPALALVRETARRKPTEEKFFVFVTDACLQQQQAALGLQIVALGLAQWPNSARLHYQRGVLLSLENQSAAALAEYARARALAPGEWLAALAAAQTAVIEGQPQAAAAAARRGLRQAPANGALLTILGRALLDGGAQPGQPEFTAARQALEQAVAVQPENAPAQLALGQAAVLAGDATAALGHLESARRLQPDNPTVYSLLALAYRQQGDQGRARAALATLAALNRRQRARYQAAPASYVGAPIAAQAVPH